MNYLKCLKLYRVLVSAGVAVIVIGRLIWSSYIQYLGGGMIILGIILRILFWKCPYCGYHIPFHIPQKETNFLYRCPNCGKELKTWL